jgi:hypothetical protein
MKSSLLSLAFSEFYEVFLSVLAPAAKSRRIVVNLCTETVNKYIIVVRRSSFVVMISSGEPG